MTGGTASTPDPSFNGLAITGSQYGAREAGLPDNPGTAQCDAIMKAGNAPLSHDGDGYAGGVCDQFAVWYEGAQNAPALLRTDLSAGLNSVGNNLFTQTDASGDPTVGNPGGQEGLGTLMQGYVEGSNVSVVEEFINMIVSQRAYDANSKVVKAADEMYQQVNNITV